jgi:hypothetical protein
MALKHAYIRLFAAAVLTVATVTAVSGCGFTFPQSVTGRSVTADYRAWNEAGIAGDAGTACAYMTDRYVEYRLSVDHAMNGSCPSYVAEVGAWVRKHPEVKSYTITDVHTNGDHATLVDHTRIGKRIDSTKMYLVHLDGRWKVDAEASLTYALPKAAKSAYLAYATAISKGDASRACSLATGQAKSILIKLAQSRGSRTGRCEDAIMLIHRITAGAPLPVIVGGEAVKGGAVLDTDPSTPSGAPGQRTIYMVRANGSWKFAYSIDHSAAPASAQSGSNS